MHAHSRARTPLVACLRIAFSLEVACSRLGHSAWCAADAEEQRQPEALLKRHAAACSRLVAMVGPAQAVWLRPTGWVERAALRLVEDAPRLRGLLPG